MLGVPAEVWEVGIGIGSWGENVKRGYDPWPV